MTHHASFPKPMRGRCPDYLAWVRKQPCAWCLKPGESEAHHLTTVGARGHDLTALPLCPLCHSRLQNPTTDGQLATLWRLQNRCLVTFLEGKGSA